MGLNIRESYNQPYPQVEFMYNDSNEIVVHHIYDKNKFDALMVNFSSLEFNDLMQLRGLIKTEIKVLSDQLKEFKKFDFSRRNKIRGDTIDIRKLGLIHAIELGKVKQQVLKTIIKTLKGR